MVTFSAAGRPPGAVGAASRVKLVVGDGGHRFHPDIAWPVIDEMVKDWR